MRTLASIATLSLVASLAAGAPAGAQPAPRYAGYLFSYFTGEGTADAADDPDHTGTTYNKMMYATTTDFRTFSDARVWLDPGHSVIDSTVLRHGSTYFRFTKDERSNTPSSPCGKFIVQERSTSLLNPAWDLVAECVGQGAIARGEGPTVFKSNTEEKWYLFIDEFGGRGYVPFETTDLSSGRWTMSADYALPARPRHGTVLPVTRGEYRRLLAAYGTPALG
jgi:hypothetical protein